MHEKVVIRIMNVPVVFEPKPDGVPPEPKRPPPVLAGAPKPPAVLPVLVPKPVAERFSGGDPRERQTEHGKRQHTCSACVVAGAAEGIKPAGVVVAAAKGVAASAAATEAAKRHGAWL